MEAVCSGQTPGVEPGSGTGGIVRVLRLKMFMFQRLSGDALPRIGATL